MITVPYIQSYIYTEPETKTSEYLRISSYSMYLKHAQDKQIDILFSTDTKAIPASFLYFTSVINRRFEGLKDLGHCYPHIKLSQSQLIHEVGQLKGQNTKKSNTCYGTKYQFPERRELIKLKEWTELKCHQ